MFARFTKSMNKQVMIIALGIVLACPCASEPTALENIPFWQASSGFWISDNTYLDARYAPKIPYYQTLSAIDVQTNTVTTEERKFYPPGAFAAGALGLKIAENRGVELIQITYGEASDNLTRVDFAPHNSFSEHQQTWLDIVSDDTAVMTVSLKSSREMMYKMLITMPTLNSRVIINLGVNGSYSHDDNADPLRGISMFSATRINQQDFEAKTTELEAKFNVGTVVYIDEQGHYQAKSLLP